MNFKMSLRALSRTKSSSVLSMCILILFPVMTLLLTSGPSSPLDDEEDDELPSSSSSSSDVLDLCCRRRRRCSSSLDRSLLRRCLLLDDAFLSSPSPRFRWRRPSSLFDFPLLLLDRLLRFFFLPFLDLLRSRSLDLERDPLPPLRSEDDDRDLDRRVLLRPPPRSFPSLSLERRSRSRRWREGEADDGDDDGERPLLLLSPDAFPSRSDFEGGAAAAAGPPSGSGPSFSVSDMAYLPSPQGTAHARSLSPGLSSPPSVGVLSPVPTVVRLRSRTTPDTRDFVFGGTAFGPSRRVGRRGSPLLRQLLFTSGYSPRPASVPFGLTDSGGEIEERPQRDR